VSLSWTASANAANYLILRNEVDCDYSSNVIATVPAPTTSFTDSDLPNGLPFFYRVQAQAANAACESAVSNCASAAAQPFAGSIKLDRATYGCSTPITITVTDANVGSSTTTATIESTTEPVPETVLLTETAPGSAKFVGTITTTSGPSPTGDGLLGLSHGDLIRARYVDADDGAGGSNLERTTTASGDCVFPTITNVQTTNVTDVQATITWATDESSTSIVHWGETTPPANSASVPGMTTSHSVTLTGLRSCTVYWYSVESQDAAGNVALDDKAGQYYRFETLGDFGAGLQPCHAGRVFLDQDNYGCADTIGIEVVDLDLNSSPDVPDAVTITVTSTTELSGETVLLTETGPNTSRFAGSVGTSPAPPVPGDGILSASPGDLLTATYLDQDDGSGFPATASDSSTADCSGPAVSSLRVTDLTDESAVVRWNTSEPTTGRVEWGSTPSLGNVVTDANLSTSHALTVQPLSECGRFFFRVFSTDAHGNTTVEDAQGNPFEFNAWTIPGIVFQDGFESETGWTREGEWQRGSPQGKGSPPPDPTSAYRGTQVLGHDLTGLGPHPGDYEPQKTESATSPVINASSLTRGVLKYRRWLNVGGGAISYIDVKKAGTWNNVWFHNSALSSIQDQAWVEHRIDISSYADGNPSLQIRFRQFGGTSSTANRSGWNIDKLIIKSDALPDFASCGSCGGAPSFAGLRSAEDDSICADTGVRLSWSAAPAWGTGTSGTYSVYRDTTPNFTPTASNRIATGLAETAYLDATAPNDVTLYYLVRAENDETCSNGPNNGGVTDSNTAYLAVRDEQAPRPVPGSVGSSLRAEPNNDAHVRLSWAAAPNAHHYSIYRASSPQGPFTRIAETTALLFEDRDQMLNSTSWYYLVQAADGCGNETP
jgi:hypothetical protein